MWIVIRYLSASCRLLRPLQFTWRHAGNPDSHVLRDAVLVAAGMEAESFSSAGLVQNSGCTQWMVTVCSKTALLAAFR